MSSTPSTIIDPNTLALHQTAPVATHYGHTHWTTKVNGGNLYQWDNGTPVFVPRSTEFRFAEREKKRRDALEAFDAAIRNLRTDPTAALPLGTETRLAEIAETLRQKRESGARASQEARMAEEQALRLLDELLGLNSATPLK